MLKWFRKLGYGLVQLVLFGGAILPSQHLRRWLFCALGLKLGEHSVVYGGAQLRLPWRIKIGRGTVIGNGASLDGRGGLVIGNFVNMSSEVMIWTEQHDYRATDFGSMRKAVAIEDYVWLGPRVIVLPGVRVAEGCVVGAGAVVSRDTEPYGLYVGIPARRIRERPRGLSYGEAVEYVPFV